MSIVKKKKHVSKKNKKDWRKHCDIRDVEEFLEDQRLEERLGKFEGKANDELFIVDTVGAKKAEDVAKEPKLSARARKQALLALTTPRCFEVFNPTSKVQDPLIKRNHVNPVGSKPSSLSKLTIKRKLSKGYYEKRSKMIRKDQKKEKQKRLKAIKNKHSFNMDMWSDKVPVVKVIPETLKVDMISKDAVLHNVLPDQRIRSKPPLAKTLSTPAVNLPHPGVSYNPSYQEHQDLLQKVCEREKYMMKKERKIVRATTKMFSRVTPAQLQQQWIVEMKQGLPDKDNNDIIKKEDSDVSDTEYKAINPPVKNKKKDHKARRKQRERLVERERLKLEKINKKKISDLYKLRKLKASVDNMEKRQTEMRKKRIQSRNERAKEAIPELSAHKVPVLEPDFVEPEALSGDLRNVKVNSNLLRERYESLQRRGIIAGAKIMMKKKRKVKSYFKPGCKVTENDAIKYTQVES